MTTQVQLHVNDAQFSQAIETLGKFVAIPSVSNPNNSDYKMEHLINAAQFAETELKALDFAVTLISIKESAPFVIAEKIIDTALPTILLYAHYDVQPVDREKWKSDPFVMVERDERLYGRGSSDDKGGIIGILTALQVFKDAGKALPVNIKILFEGEEEYGSANMEGLIKQEAARLNAHALVILDGSNKSVNEGTLTSSTRGLMNMHLSVEALEKPVHSGIGGLIPDPSIHFGKLIGSLQDARSIEGIQEGYASMSDIERETLKKGSIDHSTYLREQGAKDGVVLRGDGSESVYERVVGEPLVTVVNMQSGVANGGNSIQAHASGIISVRVLPGQDPAVVAQVIAKHIHSQPNVFNLSVKTTFKEGAFAWKADFSDRFSSAYTEALKENFPGGAVAMPIGGALPLIYQFKQVFPDLSVVVPGVEDPDTSAHSHDESQHIPLWRRSIDSLVSFLNKAGEAN
ncbi:MAG: M20/M25/M40 family metallo-hydrolase [Parachlamydiaceae bacterium]